MIEHVSLGTHRYTDATVFYLSVLAPLGLQLQRNTGQEVAFGTPERWSFFLYPIPETEVVSAGGMHVALGAGSREQVQAVYRAALAASAQEIFSPRERPDISPTYFGAMFADLDGHRMEVLTNAAA
ncbi:MAG TPA: VOC family protein [Burkholderiaceae bacterium]